MIILTKCLFTFPLLCNFSGGGHHQIKLEGNVDSTDPTYLICTADNIEQVLGHSFKFWQLNTGSGNVTIKKTSDDSVIEAIDVTSGQVSGSGTAQITVNPRLHG